MTPKTVFCAILTLFLAVSCAPAPVETPTATPALTSTLTLTPTQTPAPTLTPTPTATATPIPMTAKAWRGMSQEERETFVVEYAESIGIGAGESYVVLGADGLIQVRDNDGALRYYNVFAKEWVETIEVEDYHGLGAAVIIPIEGAALPPVTEQLLSSPASLPEIYVDMTPWEKNQGYGKWGQGFLSRLSLGEARYAAVDVGGDGQVEGYQADLTFVYRRKGGEQAMILPASVRGVMTFGDDNTGKRKAYKLSEVMNEGLLVPGTAYDLSTVYVPHGSSYDVEDRMRSAQAANYRPDLWPELRFSVSDLGQKTVGWADFANLLRQGKAVIDGGESGMYLGAVDKGK